jgi:hypothetical protein
VYVLLVEGLGLCPINVTKGLQVQCKTPESRK